jgi:uncharacterized protein (DUF427 family)
MSADQIDDVKSPQRGRVQVESVQKRVRGLVNGQYVFDTVTPLLVWEVPYYPTYYVPRKDVSAELIENGQTKHSPSRGDATVYDLRSGDRTITDAGYAYLGSPIEELRDHVRFEWNAIDEWFEEDEQIYIHPRSPFVRVEILPSSRHVQIEIDGVVVADSHQPRILFETGLPPRYYLPKSDVRMDLLAPSGTHTGCPYKGTASYYDMAVNGTRHPDLVWWYPTPLPESARVGGLVCFYNEKVDLIIDGVRQERPRTKFS